MGSPGSKMIFSRASGSQRELIQDVYFQDIGVGD